MLDISEYMYVGYECVCWIYVSVSVVLPCIFSIGAVEKCC